jgi:16S rRNA (cytosine1402-N4)-methyltransferase
MRTRRSQSSSDPVSPNPRSSEEGHRTVLLHEAVEALEIERADTIADMTLGGSGHAREITRRLGRDGFFVGFDLDSDAITRAEAALKDAAPRTLFINANFRHCKEELRKRSIDSIDGALFDLGWSSFQLGSGRGFSFLSDEPLLMTYGAGGLTARDIVNEWEESSIADVLFGWGEERYARRIARMIVSRRLEKPFETARDLAEAIRDAVPAGYRFRKTHPATKTFQALRIAVNDEIGALRQGIAGALDLLTDGGRMAVITFHSIEDREVKHLFANWEREGFGQRVGKKPLAPSEEELSRNPRSRSAKLRVFEKSTYDKLRTQNEQIQAERPAGNAAA